jgi:vacuolar-type H+-ATPase subunit H
MPGFQEKVGEIQSDISAGMRAFRRSKTLETKVAHAQDVVRLYEQAASYARRGAKLRPTDPETGRLLDGSWDDAIAGQRRALDEMIRERLAEEVDEALEAAETKTGRKREGALSKLHARVKAFRKKMLNPTLLDAAESKVTAFMNDEF